jgi:hypothetical protein
MFLRYIVSASLLLCWFVLLCLDLLPVDLAKSHLLHASIRTRAEVTMFIPCRGILPCVRTSRTRDQGTGTQSSAGDPQKKSGHVRFGLKWVGMDQTWSKNWHVF